MKKFLCALTAMFLSVVSPVVALAKTGDPIRVVYREENRSSEEIGYWCVLDNDTIITGYGVSLGAGETVFRKSNGDILMNGNISVKTDNHWTTYRFNNGSYVEIGTSRIYDDPSIHEDPGNHGNFHEPDRNGWVEFSNGKWKYQKNGQYLKKEWLNGQYYFNSSGYMVTGKKTIDGDCYYFGTGDDGYGEGALVTNAIVKVDGNKYYFGRDGKMLKNTILVNDRDGRTYIINGSGIIAETAEVIHSSF